MARTVRPAPASPERRSSVTTAGLHKEAKSGRRESNPHDQLGRSVLAHGHLCCSSNALVSRSAFLRSATAYLSVLLATGPSMARRLGGLWMQTTGATLVAVTRCSQCACRRLPRTAIARMGCCTSLLYGTTGTSKNTVKVALTSTLLHSRLRRRLVCSAATWQVDDQARALVRPWSTLPDYADCK